MRWGGDSDEKFYSYLLMIHTLLSVKNPPRFSSNSEASGYELLENREKMFFINTTQTLMYRVGSNLCPHALPRCERVNAHETISSQ